MASDTELISAAVSAPLADAGLLLEDVKTVAAGGHTTVEVVVDLDVDTAEPVSMDAIERATRIVGESVDELPLFADRPYTLEVTSPGADRRLTLPRHFKRVVGRRIEAFTAEQRYEGDLTAVAEDGPEGAAITLTKTRAGRDMRPGKGPRVPDPFTLPLSSINRANVVLTFK